MTEHRSDESFGDLLRDVLLEARPTAAPSALRERVGRIPREQGSARPVGEVKHWLVNAARLAAVVALLGVVVGLAALSTFTPDVGVPPTPEATAVFDPSIDGIGIVGDVGNTLGELPWILAISLGCSLLILSLRYGRVWRVAAVAAAGAVLAAAQFVSTQPGLTFYNSYGAPLGIDIERAPDITDGPDAFHIAAEPNENFLVTFNVSNVGTLPIRILGIVDRFPGERFAPRWSALGVQTDAHGGFGFPDAARPFEPIDLEPEAVVNFYLVGRAGPCALGRTGTPNGVGVGMRRLEVAFSVLGMPATQDLELPFVVGEAQRDGCVPRPETDEVLVP